VCCVPRNTRAPADLTHVHVSTRVGRGNAACGAWARGAHRTPPRERGKAHHTHHANHVGNPTRTHAYHAHHSETQAARTHSTGDTRIAANGGAYAHSGSMHQDGRRCMEVGTSNKWYTETAAKQPAAHSSPPGPIHQWKATKKNPEIHLSTTGANPPVESNQTPATLEPETTPGKANAAPTAAQSHMARQRDPGTTMAVRNDG
jgi:hypothetical protein